MKKYLSRPASQTCIIADSWDTIDQYGRPCKIRKGIEVPMLTLAKEEYLIENYSQDYVDRVFYNAIDNFDYIVASTCGHAMCVNPAHGYLFCTRRSAARILDTQRRFWGEHIPDRPMPKIKLDPLQEKILSVAEDLSTEDLLKLLAQQA